jgi:hypothetical protein
MTDPDKIAYEVLTQTGTALYSLVGARVDYALAPVRFDNTAARLVFRPESGDAGLWNSPIKERTYLMECWGGDAGLDDWAGAKAVYEAVFDLWHDANKVTVASGVLMSGYQEQAGVPLVNPDSRLKYFVARFGGKFKGA